MLGRGCVLGSALALAIAGASGPTRAGEPPPAEPEGSSADASEDEGAPARVKVFGRILARAAADERKGFARELGISQARLGMRAGYGFADAVVEADVADADPLKDAYVRFRDGSRRLRLYGGKLKAPFLERELEPTWELPRIRRGLVASYLVGDQQLGGRRLGAMAEYRPRAFGLRVQAGIFEGAKPADGGPAGEDLATRVTARPWKPLTVGASGYFAELARGAPRLAAGADAALELHGVRLAAEAMAGRLALGHFTSQTAMLSWDLPLGKKSGWVAQPVIGAEGLQLRGAIAGVAWGACAGANLTYRDQFRFQLQLERAQRPGDGGPANDVALQFGTRF